MSGCSAAWLARLHGVQEAAGSNPVTQISFISATYNKYCVQEISEKSPVWRMAPRCLKLSPKVETRFRG